MACIIKRKRVIPHSHPNVWMLKTHYDYIKESLTESKHIFKLNDHDYDTAIKNAVIKCFNDLENEEYLTIFDNHEYAYTTIDYHFKLLKTIHLYIRIWNEDYDDCINLSYNDANILYPHNPPVFSSKITTIKVYNKEKEEFEYKDVEEIEEVSIVLQLSKQTYWSSNYIEESCNSIRHELIHILHEIQVDSINERAGYAFTCANRLCAIANIDFPDINTLPKIDQDNPKQSDFVLILAACFYYLDTSEYSAWLDTYSQEYKNLFRYRRDVLQYNLMDKSLEVPRIWKIMSIINDMLKNYKKQILLIYDSQKYKEVIDYYFERTNIKRINGNILLNHYQKRVQSFLNKCESIHKDTMEKYKEEIALYK